MRKIHEFLLRRGFLQKGELVSSLHDVVDPQLKVIPTVLCIKLQTQRLNFFCVTNRQCMRNFSQKKLNMATRDMIDFAIHVAVTRLE